MNSIINFIMACEYIRYLLLVHMHQHNDIGTCSCCPAEFIAIVINDLRA